MQSPFPETTTPNAAEAPPSRSAVRVLDRKTRHRLAALEGAVIDDRRSFLAALADQRPWLHRFATVMTGSALEAEERVQEALAQAFYRLADGPVATAPRRWLLALTQERLARLKPLRGRRWRPAAECPRRWFGSGQAGSRLFVLPPRERACVFLKDRLGYSLQELSEILDSPVAAVKAAFYRGRRKLEAAPKGLLAPAEEVVEADERSRLGALAAAFNARAWAAVLEQVSDRIQLELPGSLVAGKGEMARLYLPGFERTDDWRLLVTPVDGEDVLVRWRRSGDGWRPATAIRLTWDGDLVVGLRDFQLVAYLLDSATVGEPDLTSLSPLHLPRRASAATLIESAPREEPPSPRRAAPPTSTLAGSGGLLRGDAGLL